MSRTGYVYSNVTPGGVTQAVDFRAFLEANLTTWTVGSLQIINAGVNERDYFVLTHTLSSVEILVYLPQGTSTTPDVTSGITSTYRETCNTATSTDNTLSFACAPQGGYTTSFGLARDPINLDFWPPSSSKVVTIDYWAKSQPNMNLYVIENTSHAEFFVYCGRNIASSGVAISMVGYSAQMHTPLVGAGVQPDGFMYMGVSSTAANVPKTPRLAKAYWTTAWAPVTWTTTTTTQYPARQGMTALTDSNQPASDGSYLTRTIPFLDGPNGRYLGIYNPEIMVEVGRMTTTYGSKRGPSTTPWVHIWIDYFTVWAESLPTPTVG